MVLGGAGLGGAEALGAGALGVAGPRAGGGFGAPEALPCGGPLGAAGGALPPTGAARPVF